ncbi:uncharacterized protein KY384_006028 [Bacidia gigantensis]|uniref:uncharacterized protein n=1 Tax=Bacidia gigantensis TaxID=2732470 RepID=UPI001D053105|nr:uncharacterized protein KY384_006028 [Bacidia gigantensis]KAG8529392.1 hypothetical protein KY384_006028 [Bacidia gigantensis]
MALASAPSTPDRGLHPFQIRRAFTAPIKGSKRPSLPAEAEAQGAETLFEHTAAKIVSFNTSGSSGRQFSAASHAWSQGNEEPPDSLPWASLTERTIAAGNVYRVLGSVAFLRSGSTLHPILAKSQCWCVDGVSKFVLRIRAYSYYRIELPFSNDEEGKQVEDFKIVLDKVLQYEKTPCPFKRSFTVDLPEAPETPVKMIPWTPKRRFEARQTSLSQTPELETHGHDARQTPPDLATRPPWKPEEGPIHHSPPIKVADYPLEGSDASRRNSEIDNLESETAGVDVLVQQNLLEQMHSNIKKPVRPATLSVGRVATAPPQLFLQTRPCSSIHNDVSSAKATVEKSTSDSSSSVDSFCSFRSPESPSTPSPSAYESSEGGLHVSRTRGHEQNHPETTTLPRDRWDLNEASPETPICSRTTSTSTKDDTLLPEFTTDSLTRSPPGLRVRQHFLRRRTQSPLPPSANLYVPYSPKDSISGNHLTTAILQRTCSLLLGPPVHLVALMLRIAKRITHGALQGYAFGHGERGEKIPCSWDFSSDASEGGEDCFDEDDYGTSLDKSVSGDSVRLQTAGGSWEID